MTSVFDDFNRAALGNNAPNGSSWLSPGTWAISGNRVHATTTTADGWIAFDTFNSADVTITHAEDQVSGAIGVHAVGDSGEWVRLVAEPASGWTWKLESKKGGVITTWDSWAGQGAPAGRKTTLRVRGSRYVAMLDGAVLGEYIDDTQGHLTGNQYGIAADNCTAFVDDLLVVPLESTGGYGIDHDPEGVGTVPIGTIGPNGEPFEGTGDWVIYYHPPTAPYFGANTATDAQLVWDHGDPNFSLTITVEGDNDSHDIGILARWVDQNNYTAVALRPDVSQVILYQRTGGSFSVVRFWGSGSGDHTGDDLTLTVIDNIFHIRVGGGRFGATEITANPTATKIGIWAYNTTTPFSGLYGFGLASPAAALPTGSLFLNQSPISHPTSLSTGRIQVTGGDLGQYEPAVIEPGHVAIAGSDLYQSPDLTLDAGHTRINGTTLTTTALVVLHADSGNYAPIGAGRVPIGLVPFDASGPVALIDEDGNFLIDEDGDVLIFD